MPFLSKEQSALIQQMVLERSRELTPANFALRFPVDVRKMWRLGLDILMGSVNSKDRDDVSGGMLLAFFFGITDEYTDTLLHLAGEPWHYAHEDIAMALDRLRLRDSRVARIFYDLACSKHEYLAYDDAHALGVKCIWGLGNMGTVEAIDALGRLRRSGNIIFEENAEEQLDRIESHVTSKEVEEAVQRARLGR